MCGQPVLHESETFRPRPVGRLFLHNLDVRIFRENILNTLAAVDFGRMSDWTLEDHDISLASHALGGFFHYDFAAFDIIRQNHRGNVGAVYSRIRDNHGYTRLGGLFDLRCTAVEINRTKNDAIEFLRNHRGDLIVLDQRIIATIENG